MGIAEEISDMLGDVNETTDNETGSSESNDALEETGSETEQETEQAAEGSEDEETSSSERDEVTDQKEGDESKEEETPSDESEVERLQAEVDRLSALVGQSEKEPESSLPSSPENLFDEDFDFDQVIESEDSFKSFLTDFATKVQSQAHQNILQSLPDTVSSYIGQQLEYRDQIKDFYKDNEDLTSVKKYVAVTANQVAAEKPDLELPKVLDETAARVRKALGLKKKAVENDQDSKQKKSPAFSKGTSGTTSSKKPKQELSAMEKEIMDLIEED